MTLTLIYSIQLRQVASAPGTPQHPGIEIGDIILEWANPVSLLVARYELVSLSYGKGSQLVPEEVHGAVYRAAGHLAQSAQGGRSYYFRQVAQLLQVVG